LLKKMKFSLHRNRKLESGLKNPPPRRVRNRQFLYIQRQHKQFTARGAPVISVDTKKKELIGRFKNPGELWQRHAQAVNDHDFRSDAKGMAIPYGLYDPQRNHGFVAVRTSRETPAFAWMPSASGGGSAVARSTTPRPGNYSFSPIRAAAIPSPAMSSWLTTSAPPKPVPA
jgi:hypothetical protein